MANHLRLLQLLLGRGRWDYALLADELAQPCRQKTRHRASWSVYSV